MIDEKKIEEAAQAICFDDKMSYDSYCKIEGFRKGAKWAINEFLKNLWHPASEKPLLRSGKCLVVYNGGTIGIFKISFVYEMLSNYGKNGMGWKYWCYVSDLFPKQGGE
ncbi:hypothetical protein [Segatella copri]|uniref:Uncharacterized protein n=1 Tax=Segatella copri TaxID=165179 RepID=A0A3R6EJT2_9BACT|nr:hypothetical protein [Segatella copri]RHH85235.1 hypothetical protein DW192_00445 [Segatella copri]